MNLIQQAKALILHAKKMPLKTGAFFAYKANFFAYSKRKALHIFK